RLSDSETITRIFPSSQTAMEIPQDFRRSRLACISRYERTSFRRSRSLALSSAGTSLGDLIMISGGSAYIEAPVRQTCEINSAMSSTGAPPPPERIRFYRHYHHHRHWG